VSNLFRSSSCCGILFLSFVTLILTASGFAASEKVLHSFISYPLGATPEGSPVVDGSGNVYEVTEFGGEHGNGAVLKISRGAHGQWAKTVIYSFNDLSFPGGGLTVDSAGNLYGTTLSGGSGKWGAVYRLSHSLNQKWTLEILHSFTGKNGDGAQPFGSLVLDSAGSLYGATYAGGAYGTTNTGGTAFELTPSSRDWSETILYSFQSSNGSPISGVVRDVEGNLYGESEVELQSVQVFQLKRSSASSWTENILCTCGAQDTSLLIDAEGNLYGNNPGTYGSVFELERSHGWRQVTLYDFSGGGDGADPWQSLAFDSKGNLYGVTAFGGGSESCFDSDGCGTVFELVREGSRKWKHRIVYAFENNEIGDAPNGIVIDNAGVLYGTTLLGGNQGCSTAVDYEVPGCGTIFALTATPDHGWKYHQVLAFPYGDGQNPAAGLVPDGSGNLYGTTPYGGAFADNGGGVVFKLGRGANGGWSERLLHSFGGPNDGQLPAGNLIFDTSGSIYGVTTYTPGNQAPGTVFKLTPKTDGAWTESLLYTFTGYPKDGGNPTAGLVSDANGNLYGTTSAGGSGQCLDLGDDYFVGCGTVFELSPSAQGGWTETILYVFTGYPDDGSAPSSSLTMDESGNLYGSTAYGGASGGCVSNSGVTLGCGTIFKLSLGSGNTWTETGYYSFPQGGSRYGVKASGLTFGPGGHLYGTTGNSGSYDAGSFFRVSAGSGGAWTVNTLYSFGQQSGDGSGPNGVIFDSSNNAYGTTVNGGKANNNCTVGCGTVFELSPASGGSWTERILYDFKGPYGDGMWPTGSVVMDDSGNLIGTTTQGEDRNWIYDGWGGSVFEVTP
jgi:hypothetical protein